MSQRADPFRIGLFVLGAVVLIGVAVMLFTSGVFGQQRSPRVSYFAGSVSGLTVGAPVTFRGVKVGEVTAVQLKIDVKSLKALIPVEYYVDRAKIDWTNGTASEVSVDNSVQHGLRAELVMLSFVTGQQGIDLDLRPDVPAVFHGAGGDLPEVPVMRSAFELVKDRLSSLPVEELAQQILKTVSDLDALVTAPETKATLQSVASLAADLDRSEREELGPTIAALHRLLDEANGTLADLHGKLNVFADAAKTAGETMRMLTPPLQRALDDTDQATKSARRTLDALSSLVETGRPSRADLDQTLRDLSLSTRALRDFAEEIRRDPSLLLVGKR